MEAAVQAQIMRAAAEWVATLDAIVDGVVLVVNGRLARGNRAFATMASVDVRGLPNMDFDDAMRLAVGNTFPLALGKHRLRHDGRVIEVDVRPAPDILGHVVVLRDSSHEVRAEGLAAALAHVNDVGLLFSGIRHELRNPLNALGMQLAQLSEGNHSHDTVDLIKRCQHQFGRLDRLVRLLRPVNLADDLVMQTLSLPTVIAELLSLVSLDAGARQVVISVDVGDISVCADERLMIHVLMNLVTNAMEALDTVPIGSGRAITIAATVVDMQVQLRVADNGPGIPNHRHAHLFAPFETTKEAGTGLGLYLVAHLMDLQQGTVVCEQTSGGTNMVLTLPRGAP